MRFATLAALLFLSVFGGWSAACSSPATELMIHVDTDLPADPGLTLRAAVRASSASNFDGRWDHEWSTGAGADGGLSLPGSFAIVPRAGAGLQSAATLFLEVANAHTVVRRRLSAVFIPHRTGDVRVFLTARCAAAGLGCLLVPAAACTRQQLCEEAGQTCGDDGACANATLGPDRDGGIDAAMDVAPADAGPCGGGCPMGQVCTTLGCRVCGPGANCCADGTICPNGNVCGTTGTCGACGAPGQACCAGGTCAANTACTAGMCPCGHTGEPCCANASCTTTGTVCGGNNTCVACGDVGQPCCASQACAVDRICTPSGSCSACGDRNQLCCTGNTCHGLTCSTAFMGIPVCVCGGRGQLCCGTANTCDAGLTCDTSFMGIPICSCGRQNNLCCEPGDVCEASLRCNRAFMNIPICTP